MINPAEARCVSYSTIKSFGTRSRPARARVNNRSTRRSAEMDCLRPPEG